MHKTKKLFEIMKYIIQPAFVGIIVAILMILVFPNAMRQSVSKDTIDALIEDNISHPLASKISFSNAVSAAAPSVVNIYTLKDEKNNYLKTSLGSGVIMSNDGIIVTNFHVMKNAVQIKILLYDGRESPAEIIDWDRELDLAILKVNLDDLKPISLGHPDSAKVGDIVLAIGNPRGIGQAVTQGIISAVGINGLRLNTLENFIQTDAAINEGSSGGALIDVNGNLLGINTLSLNGNGASGIGFAIPVDEVKKVTSDIIKYGRVIRGWLGIGADMMLLTKKKSDEIGYNRVFVISEVVKSSPAAKSGLRIGDIILTIDNTPILDPEQSIKQITNVKPGQPVLLKILRTDVIEEVTVLAGDRALKK
ncbi:MAG: 2-alkenal reductase [Porticoccaceae bacterium]|nr:2-alkenal reductase [Porticoccaceae bacterium]